MNAELIPAFARKVLHIGEVRAESARRFAETGAQVWAALGFREQWRGLPSAFFDCVVCDTAHCDGDDLLPFVQTALSALPGHGRLIFLSPLVFSAETAWEKIEALFYDLGWLRQASPTELPDNDPGIFPAGQFVRVDYNPIRHARELAGQGRPGWAIEVLETIPQDVIANNRNLALIAAEKQRLYLEWQKSLPPESAPHRFFFKARREFAQATSALPHLHPVYRTQADYWCHLGSPEMARRLLRSVLQVAEDETTRNCLTALSSGKDDHYWEDRQVPEWSGNRRPPAILVLTHDFSDYGMDSLYDGLCRVLGAGQIVEYPWKPMLHGQQFERVNNYPCAFNHPSSPLTLDEVIGRLKAGRFDLMVYADVVQMAHEPAIRSIMDAGRNLPLVLYDTWDDCYTPMDCVSRYIGSKPIDLVFKREMLQSVNYGADVLPLPFGFSPRQTPGHPAAVPRDRDVFWAGKAIWGLRPLGLPCAEKILQRRLDHTYTPQEYTRGLQRSRIGLSFFGSGFDTVRYWEVPAYGALLLSEKSPIRIPFDFRDGESAVFFSDLPELEDKLRFYLSHPAETERIALAGQRHQRRYHTTEARARQFLGYLEEHFQW